MAGLENQKSRWIVANFKAHKTIAESLEWVSQVGPHLENREDVKVVVCPNFLDLEEVKKAVLVGNFNLMVGSQDISPFPEGAYTGEEAASILKEIVDVAIIGHSERRQNFGETDEMVAQKAKQAKENNIIPLVCVQDATTPIPEGCDLVAYEPIFAIGTGQPDTPTNANEVSGQIHETNPDVAVLYGGSVTDENAKAFLDQENIDGLLIGGASLDAEKFVKIIQIGYGRNL